LRALCPLLVLGWLLFGISLPGFAQGPQLFTAEIDTSQVICWWFLGFGAEWDSYGYNAAGITDDDFATIRQRVEWMHLPLARIMMQAKWCYQGDDQYDWESAQMRSLYRNLDVCQERGMTVILTEWGCEPEWLKTPDVQNVADPKYAEIIANYMDYLINRKGYSCIEFFVFVNEPNLEVGDWERWAQGVKNVHAAFQKRGLADKIPIMAPDQSNIDIWHKRTVDELHDFIGAYGLHHYAFEAMVRDGKLFDYFIGAWGYTFNNDPNAGYKPFIIGEAGMQDGAQHPYGNRNIDAVSYGVFMADYAIQAANAGSSAVIAWMLDDNSHPNFFWGMWRNKPHALGLRPWYYTWSLLSRYFPPGAKIYYLKPKAAAPRVLAASYPGEVEAPQADWTFCIVNNADEAVPIDLRVPFGPVCDMKQYVFNSATAKTDTNGFPLPFDRIECDLDQGTRILCSANTVVVLTSLERD